jgi:hypothetical protein
LPILDRIDNALGAEVTVTWELTIGRVPRQLVRTAARPVIIVAG